MPTPPRETHMVFTKMIAVEGTLGAAILEIRILVLRVYVK